MFRVVSDSNAKYPPASEVLSRMRDNIVGSVRTSLLAGLFSNRPDELQVRGDVSNSVITITVKDLANTEEFSKVIPMGEFMGMRGTPDSSEETQASANDPKALRDSPFTPRVQLSPRVDVDQFRNTEDFEKLRQSVLSVAQGKVNEFVSEYLEIKSHSS